MYLAPGISSELKQLERRDKFSNFLATITVSPFGQDGIGIAKKFISLHELSFELSELTIFEKVLSGIINKE